MQLFCDQVSVMYLFWKEKWRTLRELVDDACIRPYLGLPNGSGLTKIPWFKLGVGPITLNAVPLIASLREILFFQSQKDYSFTCIQFKALKQMLIQWQELENSRLILTTFEDPRAYSQEESRARHEKPSAWGSQLARVFCWRRWAFIVTGSFYFLSQVRLYLQKTEKSN